MIELSTNYKGILRDFLSFQLEGNIKGNIVDTLEVFFSRYNNGAKIGANNVWI